MLTKLSVLADSEELQGYVDTLDEYSGHTGGAFCGPEEGFGGVSPVSGGEVKPIFSPTNRVGKVKRPSVAVPGVVLATGSVSRRLDFSKDRISKALAVVRTKREGTQPFRGAFLRYTYIGVVDCGLRLCIVDIDAMLVSRLISEHGDVYIG